MARLLGTKTTLLARHEFTVGLSTQVRTPANAAGGDEIVGVQRKR